MAWITVLNLLLLVKLFILLDGGTEARDAVIDRLALTTEQIDASGEVFEDEKAKDHKIFRSVRLREFVASGIWYGAAVGICVVGVLLSTIRWWNRVIPPKNAGIQYPSKQVVGWIFAIAFVGLFIRLPRMDFSLYNDESFNFTRYIHGQFKPDKETGELKFRKVSWQQTAWGNHFGNNGELYSIAARASHDFWQKQNNTADGEVSEVALRIPSLLAGVGSIIIISLCGVLCFGTRTGIIAAILTALHPWHIRYSTEARSYGMVLLFSAIILLSLVLAIREGRWRWWLLFLLTEVLCLWAYIGSVYFLLAVNLVALTWILWSHRTVFPRWLAANSLAAALFLQITGPSLPQIAYAGANMGSLQGWTGISSSLEILGYLVSGMPLVNAAPENPISPAWLNFGVIGTVLFTLGIVGLVFGLVQLIRKRQGSGLFISATAIGSVVVAIAISNLTSSVVHHWYVIYALPGFVLMKAIAVKFAWASKLRFAGPALLGLFVLGFIPPARNYLTQGKEPLREVMEFMRGDVYPFDEKSGHPLVAAFWSDVVYDPTIIYTPSIADLEKAMERARTENRPLYVEFGYRPLALQHNPDLVAYIEDSGKFEHLKTFHGLEETQFTHYVFRLKLLGNPVAK